MVPLVRDHLAEHEHFLIAGRHRRRYQQHSAQTRRLYNGIPPFYADPSAIHRAPVITKGYNRFRHKSWPSRILQPLSVFSRSQAIRNALIIRSDDAKKIPSREFSFSVHFYMIWICKPRERNTSDGKLSPPLIHNYAVYRPKEAERDRRSNEEKNWKEKKTEPS